MDNFFKPKPSSFKNSFCEFQEVLPDAIRGLVPQFTSKSGSCYYYTKLGMYRSANHWGRLANSKWRLLPLAPETASKTKIGFASWDAFYPDNALDKLYYLEVDFDMKTANYQHKNSPKYDGKAVLRNSFETTKILKKVRNILTLTSWAKYIPHVDIEDLRKEIILLVIYTERSLDEIKKSFH